jgi:ketosteroid isomerase-like protein
MLQMRYLHVVAVLALVAFPNWLSVAAQVDDKSAVEETVRAMEDAVQAYDFTRQDSLLAPGARWIERSRPELAAFDGTGFFVEAKAAKILLTNHPHDFDIHIQGDVAWVTLLVDVATIASNETGRALLARTEVEETGKPSPDDQREWRATYVESEVLVKTPRGWKIVLGHTSRLPEQEKEK